VYVDDVILLSTSVCPLQKMLNVFCDIGDELDIVFNANKLFLFKIGLAYYNDCAVN